MKIRLHYLLFLPLFLFSSCSSVFYTQNQKIDIKSKDENKTIFSLYDEAGNFYPMPLKVTLSNSPGGMSLLVPKFSRVKYQGRWTPRINYLLAEDNGNYKAYKLTYRMRYDGSKFEPYATFGIVSTSFAALTVAMIPISIASNDLGVSIVNLLFAAASAAGVIYVDLPTGLLSQIYSWSLSRKGIYRKWKFVSIEELDQIDYPEFLSGYRFDKIGESNLDPNRPSSRMKRLVSTYKTKVESKVSQDTLKATIISDSDIKIIDSVNEKSPELVKRVDNISENIDIDNLVDSTKVPITKKAELVEPVIVKDKIIRNEGVISGYYEENYAENVVAGSPGYYIVSGIYRSSSLSSRMKDAMQKKGINTDVFRDKKNNMYYMYILKFENAEEAEKAKASGLQKQYKGKLWIKIVE